MRESVLSIVFLTMAVLSFGQNLNLEVDKPVIQIGEPFTMKLSVVSQEKLQITYEAHSTFFPGKEGVKTVDEHRGYDLEIITPFSDTTYQDGLNYIWEGQYVLTGWDSSFVVIPPEEILINDSTYFFPVQLIEISSPETNPNQPIYDIQEIFTEIPPPASKFITFLKKNWMWIAIVLVVGVVLFLRLRKRKPEAIISESLKEKTLKQIDELEAKEGYNVDLKEYYFELSLILKRFLSTHYQTSIMEKTTSELERILAKAKLKKDISDLILKLLMQSDMVKFAKSKPSVEEIKQVTNEARKVVIQISDITEENE